MCGGQGASQLLDKTNKTIKQRANQTKKHANQTNTTKQNKANKHKQTKTNQTRKQANKSQRQGGARLGPVGPGRSLNQRVKTRKFCARAVKTGTCSGEYMFIMSCGLPLLLRYWLANPPIVALLAPTRVR